MALTTPGAFGSVLPVLWRRRPLLVLHECESSGFKRPLFREMAKTRQKEFLKLGDSRKLQRTSEDQSCR